MREGTVFKRGATWTYIVDVGVPGGNRRQRSKGGFARKADALEAMNEAQRAVTTGSYVEPAKLTVAEYLEDEWLPAMEATGKRSTTMRSYRMHLKAHIAPRIGEERLQGLTGAHLNALYVELLTSGRVAPLKDGPKGLSPATVRRVHAMLHKAFADAVKWNRLVRNPAAAADPPKQSTAGQADMATWSPAELRTFLAHVASDRLAPLWTVLAMTGVRRGEAVGLRWADVDLDAGRIAIRQTLVAVGYHVEYSTPKTKKGRRSVALDAGTVATLRSWKAVQNSERLAWGPAWTDTGLVFTREDGEALHPDRVTKMFDTHVHNANLPRIRLHDLRHTHATLALAAGVHPKVVSERLGHSTVSLTLDVYSHSIPALQEDAATVVAALVAGHST